MVTPIGREGVELRFEVLKIEGEVEDVVVGDGGSLPLPCR